MYRSHWMPSASASSFEQSHLHQHPHHQLPTGHQTWSATRSPPPPPSSSSFSAASPPKDHNASHDGIACPGNSASPSSSTPPPPTSLITKQEFPSSHHHLGDDPRDAKSPTSSYYHPEMNSSPGISGNFNSFSSGCDGHRQSLESPNGTFSSSQSNNRSKSSKNRPNAGQLLLNNK